MVRFVSFRFVMKCVYASPFPKGSAQSLLTKPLKLLITPIHAAHIKSLLLRHYHHVGAGFEKEFHAKIRQHVKPHVHAVICRLQVSPKYSFCCCSCLRPPSSQSFVANFCLHVVADSLTSIVT